MNENNDIINNGEEAKESFAKSEAAEEILETLEIYEEMFGSPIDEPCAEVESDGKTEFAFEWKYSDVITPESGKKKKRPQKGALTYAVIMCTVFLLAFAILAASLFMNGFAGSVKNPDRELSITEIVEKGMPSSVLIVAAKDGNMASSGSGFVVNDYGYIVTNHHVIEDALQIVVFDKNNQQYYAELVNSDAKMDLALIYAEGLKAPAATLADSDKAKMGELVVAIGCPVGSGETLSVSDGIISGFKRSVSVTNVGVIQTNAPLNPGNSGGPLFDSKGNVVGIVTAKMFYDVDVDGEKIPLDGIAYAIPINEVKEHVAGWISKDLEKPMLGIHAVSVEADNSYFYSGAEGTIYQYLNEGGKEYRIDYRGERTELTAEQINNPENIILHAKATGLLVVNVTKGLGAYGKLERGDIMVELNGMKTANTAEVREIFNQLSAGDTVDVKVYRNGEQMVLKMTLKTKGDMLAAEKNRH